MILKKVACKMSNVTWNASSLAMICINIYKNIITLEHGDTVIELGDSGDGLTNRAGAFQCMHIYLTFNTRH